MSRDKQIEEITRDIEEKQKGGWKFIGESECTTDTTNEELAEHLINKGYRKASDVAREIFEEIEEAIMQSNEISDIRMRELAPHTYKVMREAGKVYYTAIIRAVAELKKKYTEEGK